MTAMHLLGTVTAVLGLTLLGWLVYQLTGVMARRRRAIDEFDAADSAPIYEGDQMRQLNREMAHAGRVRPLDHLPSEAERTDMLTALRAVCPDCGVDHVDKCAPSALPVVDDYITGEIVAVTDIPSDEQDTGLTTVIMSRLDEFRTDWHWVGGEWHPPAGLTDALGADDWLKQLLLETELVPA